MLKEGDDAPDFRLPSDGGKTYSLKDLRGSKVVLYFYPKDDTPGCTKEACSFRDNLSRVISKGAVVLGVSKDSIASHCKFRDKYSLTFPLLTTSSGGKFGKSISRNDKLNLLRLPQLQKG